MRDCEFSGSVVIGDGTNAASILFCGNDGCLGPLFTKTTKDKQMHKKARGAIQVSIWLGIWLSLASGQGLAATIYSTKIETWGLESFTLVTGTNHAFSDLARIGHSAAWGEASASGRKITLRGKTSQTGDNGFINQYHPQMVGEITFDDVIFSDTLNSGATSVTVGVNFAVSSSAAIDRTQVNVLMAGQIRIYNPISDGVYGATFTGVPLDKPVSLTLQLIADQYAVPDGQGGLSYIEGNAAAWFRSIPFQLENGFTADSVSANIAGNQFSVVPLPAALWLFGSGLAGLLGAARGRSLRVA